MKKRSGILKRKIYMRFFTSFFLVLMLPIMVFFTVYIQYYQKQYRNKILEQAESNLKAEVRELERQAEECRNISMLSAASVYARPHNLKSNYRVSELISHLSGEVQTHSYIDGIDYYNQELPDKVYTHVGTFSSKYYRQYLAEDGQWKSMTEYMDNMGETCWQKSVTKYGTADSQKYLQYIVRMREGKCSFFVYTISLKELEKQLYQENSTTMLLDGEGRQLYPLTTNDRVYMEAQRGVSVIEAGTSDGQLKLVRYLPEASLFLEAKHVSQVFIACVLLILIAGGALVAVLSFYNNKPIEEIKKFCEEKFPCIPENIDSNIGSMEIIRLTLDKMDEKVQLLERKQREERLLLQLIYGKDCNSELFEEKLIHMNIFLEAECYQVFVAVAGEEVPDGNISVLFQMMLDENYECHMMEYSRSNVWVGIAGMSDGPEPKLVSQLESIAQKISRTMCKEFHIYVGGKCKGREKIHWSYIQALSVREKNKQQGSWGVSCFEDKEDRHPKFIYPKLEIDSLYDALVAANSKKVRLVTDVLVDFLRERNGNFFVCTTLCYDVLNTYCRAQGELEIDNPELEELMDVEFVYNIGDVEEMSRLILRIRDQFLRYIQESAGETTQDNIAIKAIAYIDQNVQNRNLNVSMVADKFQMSISNLSHQFKALTNRNISEYITKGKLEYIRDLLLNTDYSVQKIADMLGYSQTASFIRRFKQHYGMTPVEYRNMYQKEHENNFDTM